jgi:hypothetical protein
MDLTRERLRGLIRETLAEAVQDADTVELNPVNVTWTSTGFATWLVNAEAWVLTTEAGDWPGEPDEESLTSVTILNQKIQGSADRAKDIVREKLAIMGYVEDESRFWGMRDHWLESRRRV